MPDPKGFILGFDPGGAGRFGWSICEAAGDELLPPKRGKTGLAHDAWHAIEQVRRALPENPPVLAAGIDAPLFWSKTGDRNVDVILRRVLRDAKFPASKLGGTVQAVNSLQGACVVQGLLLAKYLSDAFRSLPITESHPRALCHLLNRMGHQNMIRHMTEGLADFTQYDSRCLCGCEEPKRPKGIVDDHKRDATLSAISAWAASCRTPTEWQNLYDEASEPLRISPFGVPISYWMPIP